MMLIVGTMKTMMKIQFAVLALLLLASCKAQPQKQQPSPQAMQQSRPVTHEEAVQIADKASRKAMDIPMGVAYFKIRGLAQRRHVEVRSSNYTLYGNISHRVMNTLMQFAPDVEVYSIDEAFLDLSGFAGRNLLGNGTGEVTFSAFRHVLDIETELDVLPEGWGIFDTLFLFSRWLFNYESIYQSGVGGSDLFGRHQPTPSPPM